MSVSYAKRTDCTTCGVPSQRKPRRACSRCGRKACADCRREKICCEVPQAEWPRHKRDFEIGDAVMHKRDKVFGTIDDVLPSGSCLVRWARTGFGRTYVDERDLVLRIHTKARLPHETSNRKP